MSAPKANQPGGRALGAAGDRGTGPRGPSFVLEAQARLHWIASKQLPRLEQLRAALESRDEKAIIRRLRELVPEFSPQATLLANLREGPASPDPRLLSRSAG